MNFSNNQKMTIGYYNYATIKITTQNNVITYDFSFVNNVIGQPILKVYNDNRLNYAYVNLIVNEKIRDL
ncbi:MAG: hypothetical protein ACO3UU_04175, partial [Minisyncoccia bacterium]